MDKELMEKQAKIVTEFEKERKQQKALVINPPRARRSLMHAMAMLAFAPKGMPGLVERRIPVKAAVKRCILPGCEKIVSHRGGYCCAEHCKEHKERQKVRKIK